MVRLPRYLVIASGAETMTFGHTPWTFHHEEYFAGDASAGVMTNQELVYDGGDVDECGGGEFDHYLYRGYHQ